MLKENLKKLLLQSGIKIEFRNSKQVHFEKLFDKYCKHSMVAKEEFILNLELCDKFGQIPGDYAECGVWRGGMSAAIVEVLEPGRSVHLFDSFEGLPKAREIDGERALNWQQNTNSPFYYDNCTAEQSFAEEAMRMANCRTYKIYKGWFDQTLKNYSGNGIAILRLDGDWYDSIMTCLEELFPKLNNGGIVILDDYYTWDGCSRAVHDYLSANKSKSRIYQLDNKLAYILKKDE